MDTTLKLLREIKGLKQETIAELLGISQSAYSKIERGITRLPEEEKQKLLLKLGFSGKDKASDTKEANSAFFLQITEFYRSQIKHLTEENERLIEMLSVLIRN